MGPPNCYGVGWNRCKHREGLARHFDVLIEAAGLDAGLARSWTVVRCVDYWLWGVSIELTRDPARCHAITAWLTGFHS